ncbi:Chromate transporter, chromate ion transporter (CHR) family [Exiguobacterium sp. 8H]|uniref:chromate efflux transporter n=1 Tax=unclassified Exiguobacterium TaxID=2644629 RepID=UPI0012EFE4E7|nr:MULTISPECIES: chromate efflux transporter [unclassified Exiguobacterium]VXB55042.1 Chromate transporter, chromate ion transporter (CHR) family [Exiguobacterium sp. 8A]VXB55869.1 Chromate transporter, chromate ion transporter (CHR) family [Exiguobacterium sp. 8H]
MTTERVTFKTLLEILFVSTRLGLTSFGGPVAHLGYFHEEYVRRRKWMDEKAYADLVALCQFLPGPASSQVGIGIGIVRGGILGGITSFIGFTTPSVVALILFALMLSGLDVSDAGWLYGLKVVAVAIVAHAILGMASKLTPDTKTRTIAFFALAGVLLWQTTFSQVLFILLAALAGFLLFKPDRLDTKSSAFPISKRLGAVLLSIFGALLVILPILRETFENQTIALFDSFYRAGALVFGGGHVVLPLLERELVPAGFLSEEAFLAGYGAAQAVPGPLFTFASYLGTVINGVPGGILATVAIFLPAFLLILGALPFWDALRHNPKVAGALIGVNAAVVGILIAAFYSPIFTSTVNGAVDFVFAAFLFVMIAYWKLPPWSLVIAGVLGGTLINLM